MSEPYLILYQKSRRSEEKLIELPGREKLLNWMERIGAGCMSVRIIKGGNGRD